MHKQYKYIAGAVFSASILVASAVQAQPLVTANWIINNLDNDKVVLIDLRKEEDYKTGHIQGALRATYGEFGWREKVDGIIGQLPPVDSINTKIGSLGITNDKHVIVIPYGKNSSDVGSAARVYWTFKVLGHDNVSLLDGGMNAWTKQNLYSLQSKVNNPVDTGSYPGVVNPKLIIDTVALLEEVENGSVHPIDARTDEQWNGNKKHPKARVAGAIPTAQRLPQADLIDPASGKFVSSKQVFAVATDNGWNPDGSKPIVSYCNTGHWAATAWFALSEVAGVDNVKLYDGSMVAWTNTDSNPVINSPGRIEKLLKKVTGS